MNGYRLIQLSDCLLHLDLSSNGLLQLNTQVGKLKELRFLDLRYNSKSHIVRMFYLISF